MPLGNLIVLCYVAVRSYGVGQRMSLKHTRAIVDAIHRYEWPLCVYSCLYRSTAPKQAGIGTVGATIIRSARFKV
jgi:hypothetical protein